MSTVNTATTDPVAVHPYDASDLDALISLFRDSIRIVARKDYTQDQVLTWAPDQIDRAEWGRKCASRLTLVAKMGDVCVGFSDLEPDGHVDRMYVHPGYQGRGIAKTLLRHIEQTALDRSLERLYTEASITARPFFERQGFRVIAEQTVHVRGQDFINYRMEKMLTGNQVS